MLLRGEVVAGALGFALIASAIAVWQTVEVGSKAKSLAVANQSAAIAGRAAKAATEAAAAAEKRSRIAESELAAFTANPSDAPSIETLRAELAAARQQLAATETAMTEAETQLSNEITAHTALKAKAAELTQALATAERTVAAGQQSPVRAAEPLETGSVAKPAAEPDKPAVAAERPAKKAQAKPVARRPAKTAKTPESASPFHPFF